MNIQHSSRVKQAEQQQVACPGSAVSKHFALGAFLLGREKLANLPGRRDHVALRQAPALETQRPAAVTEILIEGDVEMLAGIAARPVIRRHGGFERQAAVELLQGFHRPSRQGDLQIETLAQAFDQPALCRCHIGKYLGRIETERRLDILARQINDFGLARNHGNQDVRVAGRGRLVDRRHFVDIESRKGKTFRRKKVVDDIANRIESNSGSRCISTTEW